MRLELDSLSPVSQTQCRNTIPDACTAPSGTHTARGRGITLLHHLHCAEGDYAAHRIAHLERRHDALQNLVSDQADEIARLRTALDTIAARGVRHPWNVATIALGRPCAHPHRDFNHGWYTCVECGEDKYRETAEDRKRLYSDSFEPVDLAAEWNANVGESAT